MGQDLGLDDGWGEPGLPGMQHWRVLVHCQFFPQVGEGGLGDLGTQHFWVLCQYQVDGQEEPDGGLGGLEGPPLGTQQLRGDHQNSELPHLSEGLEGVGAGADLQHWLSVFQFSFFPQVGTEGDWFFGTQQLFCECQYQVEGQVEPEGGDGGLEGPPLGKQHDLLSHQNSELLHEGFEGPFGEVGGGAGVLFLQMSFPVSQV